VPLQLHSLIVLSCSAIVFLLLLLVLRAGSRRSLSNVLRLRLGRGLLFRFVFLLVHGGCSNCWDGGAAAAGAVLGMATGAAIASSSTAAATSSAYSSGYVAGSADAANTTSAYNAGVAAGAAAVTYKVGVNYGSLPAGAKMITTNGTNYYVSGSTWFQPAFGPHGVYYHVVPVP